MILFENGIDVRCRHFASPTVAKIRVSGDKYKFIVVGTEYGYIHTSGGDVRTWNTYSGARRVAKAYQSF